MRVVRPRWANAALGTFEYLKCQRQIASHRLTCGSPRNCSSFSHHSEKREFAHVAGPDCARFAGISTLIFSMLATQVIAAPKRGPSNTVLPVEQTAHECKRQFSALRGEAEEKSQPIRRASQQTVAPNELCRAITSYEEAELKIIGFVGANSKKCGFPPRLSQELRTWYEKTDALKEKVCPNAKKSIPIATFAT